jgi:hypothetical protein
MAIKKLEKNRGIMKLSKKQEIKTYYRPNIYIDDELAKMFEGYLLKYDISQREFAEKLFTEFLRGFDKEEQEELENIYYNKLGEE